MFLFRKKHRLKKSYRICLTFSKTSLEKLLSFAEWSWKKWVMDYLNWKIYPVPFRLHTFRFETRTRTGRTLGTTKLGHLPSIPSRCSLGCRQCTTLQFMAITTAECRMREIETGFIWLAHQVWLIAKWGHLTAFSYYWPLL